MDKKVKEMNIKLFEAFKQDQLQQDFVLGALKSIAEFKSPKKITGDHGINMIDFGDWLVEGGTGVYNNELDKTIDHEMIIHKKGSEDNIVINFTSYEYETDSENSDVSGPYSETDADIEIESITAYKNESGETADMHLVPEMLKSALNIINKINQL